ncbi:MAG TPA: type I secretion system permease/ATPase [Azospirillaceae bacterium]|nr:type I secretion system permease/ATPase [Azospirillaceae bacterium]
MTGADAPKHLFRSVVGLCRPQILAAGLFSLVVNVLMLTTSLYMMQVYDRVLGSRSVETLLYLTLMAVGALMVLGYLDSVRSRIAARCAIWFETVLAPETVARAVEAQLRGSPYRTEGLTDLTAVRQFVMGSSLFAFFDTPWIPIYLAVCFLLHPWLGAVALAGALVLLALAVLGEVVTAGTLKASNEAAMANSRQVQAAIRNAEVIDGLGMLPALLDRYEPRMLRVLQAQQEAFDRSNVLMGTAKFFRQAVQVLALAVGAGLVLDHQLSPGAMFAGSIILGRALAPVEQLLGVWKGFVGARNSFRRLARFLGEPSLRDAGQAPPPPEGRLTVEQVGYAIPGQERPILRNVGFSLNPGEVLAVIGPTAAGKTTLVRMMVGVQRPMSGRVRLDGADVFSWPREDLGRHIGYLPQDVELFEGTVFDNIARFQQTEPDRVYEAARLAGCHEMILRLPKGYDTEVGEAGAHLSGGQRQLIGLARALFGRPRFVVLDEPNANLDGNSEQALMQAIAALKADGTTVVVVSHRAGLMAGVDKVLVLRDGMVEAFDTRDVVLQRLGAARIRQRPSSAPQPIESPQTTQTKEATP